MKKMLLFPSIALLSIGLLGCGNEENPTTSEEEVSASQTSNSEKNEEHEVVEYEEEVVVETGKEEFENYISSISPIIQRNLEIAQKYEELRNQVANSEVTDIEFGEAILYEILPEGNEIQADIESIYPEKEFREVHELLNSMIAKNLLGMTEIISAVETGDASKITSANTLLAEARELERQAMYGLQDFSEEYDVPLQ